MAASNKNLDVAIQSSFSGTARIILEGPEPLEDHSERARIPPEGQNCSSIILEGPEALRGGGAATPEEILLEGFWPLWNDSGGGLAPSE
jgi:hypothetical protein